MTALGASQLPTSAHGVRAAAARAPDSETWWSWHTTTTVRSGFSAEANFEIFLHDAHRNAEKLYDAVMAAG